MMSEITPSRGPFADWVRELRDNKQSNPHFSSANTLQRALQKPDGDPPQWTAVAVSSKTVEAWFAGRFVPDDDVCRTLATMAGDDIDHVLTLAAYQRLPPAVGERVEHAHAAEVATLRAELAEVTAQRDRAVAALSSPEVRDRVGATVERMVRDLLATRDGRAWEALNVEIAEIWPPEPEEASRARLRPFSEAIAGGEPPPDIAPRDSRYAPMYFETATRIVEALVAVFATARRGPDNGRALRDMLLDFVLVDDVKARQSLLTSFSASVRAVVSMRPGYDPELRDAQLLGLVAPLPRLEDGLPMPEAELLRLDSIRGRRFIASNVASQFLTVGVPSDTAATAAEGEDFDIHFWEAQPGAFGAASREVPNLTVAEYRHAVTRAANDILIRRVRDTLPEPEPTNGDVAEPPLEQDAETIGAARPPRTRSRRPR